jgi:hypothetical protein
MGTPGDDADCFAGGLEWVDVAVGVEDKPGSWCQGKNVGATAAMTVKTPVITAPTIAATSAIFVADHSRFSRPPGWG